MKFLSTRHEHRYNEYCQRCHSLDRERKTFFYIISGSPDLSGKGIEKFYDFRNNTVNFRPDTLEEDFDQFVFCTSSDALARLALNMYNSIFPSLSVSQTFRDLDEDNLRLALEAIRYRFNIQSSREDWQKDEESYREAVEMTEDLQRALFRSNSNFE